jgi:hypothetical protein
LGEGAADLVTTAHRHPPPNWWRSIVRTYRRVDAKLRRSMVQPAATPSDTAARCIHCGALEDLLRDQPQALLCGRRTASAAPPCGNHKI